MYFLQKPALFREGGGGGGDGGGGGGENSPEYKSAKCPRTSGEYCSNASNNETELKKLNNIK